MDISFAPMECPGQHLGGYCLLTSYIYNSNLAYYGKYHTLTHCPQAELAEWHVAITTQAEVLLQCGSLIGYK